MTHTIPLTPDSLLQNRLRLRLSEHRMAEALGVPLRHYLRWERGETRMPKIAARTLLLLHFIERELPGFFPRFLTSLPRKKVGRPVGSVNLPDWMRAPVAPRGPVRPVGRPKGSKNNPATARKPGRKRDPSSERPMRRTCRHCGKIVTGGRLFHEACREDSVAEVKALQADLTARQALEAPQEPAQLELGEPVKLCRVPVAGVPCGAVCEQGYICTPHRVSLGMVRRSSDE